jgi:hypothetical protein
MRSKVLILPLIALLGGSPSCTAETPSPAPEKTYYVSTNGNDSYNGRFATHQGKSDGPFRTLARAAAEVRPGDAVQVRAGTYSEVSTWTTDGTEDAPITITSYKDETVVIDGKNHEIPPQDYGFLMKIEGDWYTVSNLEISYSGWYGLTVSGDHCTIDNVFCHHSWGAGITCNGSDGLVVNCRAWYNSMRYEYGTGENWSTGISIMGPGCARSTIRNCTAWENWGQGIKAAACQYGTIEDCVAYDNWYNFYVRDSQHVLFQRNLSYNTPGNTIERYIPSQVTILIGDETRDPASSDNTYINNFAMGGRFVISIGTGTFENGLCANNTFVNASDYRDPAYTVRIGDGDYKNARFQNNIILQEDRVDICVIEASGISFRNNNWSKKPPRRCRGDGDVAGDPRLARTGPTDPGLLTPGWFRLLEDSPARDRARSLSEVIEDFFRMPRGSRPDIGAHEISPGTGAPAGPPRRESL